MGGTLQAGAVSVPLVRRLWGTLARSCEGDKFASGADMPTRDFIISEIQRVAKKAGRAPGRQLFEKETEIRNADWYGIYWRTWGDALVDAGFSANERQSKLSTDEVLRSYAEVVRNLGRIPASVDLRMYGRGRADFPGHTTFANHFGSKAGLIAALVEWVQKNDEFADLIDLLPTDMEETTTTAVVQEGYVYLLKSGAFYKIGRSDEVERRVKEISVTLPEGLDLVHVIRTDDPSGIEAYWHRRFEGKRAKGEWFRLTSSDVKAFKRRKFQ